LVGEEKEKGIVVVYVVVVDMVDEA